MDTSGRSTNRYQNPGWLRIGRTCCCGRRSLWMRKSQEGVELCSGREGDDNYVSISKDNPQYEEIYELLLDMHWAIEQKVESDHRRLERFFDYELEKAPEPNE